MSMLEAVPALPRRTDVWNASNALVTVRYRIQAQAQPALMCQVLNLFALQYLIPGQINMLRHGDDLHIEVDVDGVSAHRAEVIGEKMRNLIDVDTVTLESLQTALPVEPAAIRAMA
ncbi:hypothetical protein IFR09_10605 [Pseudomonas syringae]|nr:hypothetical protein [Pseudomonas syringae]MBD8576755.1 hypothetical protein [Pseudomonas syringae]MBD8788384.1 hypothetical protein [Pseudomonas syringae]MBD8799416.1 hypothetical protein [Pseudomonas syringae]MBD8811613.1 hypothetical protein [Pseudomonas syringae]